MAKINIGQKFEIDNETANNRLVLRALDTGQEWYFNEDGTLGDLVDPSNAQDAATKAYVDAGTYTDAEAIAAVAAGITMAANLDMGANAITNLAQMNGADISSAAAGDGLLSDGNGGLEFGAAGGVEEFATFGDLPAPTPPALAYVTADNEYYRALPSGAYNVGSLSESGSATENPQSFEPIDDITFNDDGSKAFLINNPSASGSIVELILSTPFDWSSATIANQFSSLSPIANYSAFNDDGSIFYEFEGPQNDTVFGVPLSTPYDPESANGPPKNTTLSSSHYGLEFSNDGTSLFTFDDFGVTKYLLSTPFDLDTLTTDTSGDGAFENPSGFGFDFAFNDTGDKLFTLFDDNGPEIRTYSLTAPFDLSGNGGILSRDSTVSLSTSSPSPAISTPRTIEFNNDGSKLYLAYAQSGGVAGYVQEYTMPAGGWTSFQ